MKKLMLIAALAATMISCKEETKEESLSIVETFTVEPNQWIPNGTEGGANYGFYHEVSIPEMTSDVLKKSQVVVYRVVEETLIPMPYSDFYDGYSIQNRYVLTHQHCGFYIHSTDRGNINFSQPITFRVVIE